MSGGGASCWVCLAVTLLGVLTPGVKAEPKELLDGNKGDYFILGFPENFFAHNASELIIATHSEEDVEVIVDVPLMGWSKTVYVRKAQSAIVDLPPIVQGREIEKSNRGVRVRANATVSVYGNSKADDAADMYLGIPVDLLGSNYYAVTYKAFPTILVVGTVDNTEVCITLPAALSHTVTVQGSDYTGGDTFCCILNTFETFHLIIPDDASEPSLTGAHIVANNSVAVFSGSKCSTIDGQDVDHLVEMLLPVNLLGTRYCTTHTPNADREDVYIIVATESNTEVYYGGAGPEVLALAGDYLEKQEDQTTFLSVTSDKPILLAMFSKSNKYNKYIGQPSFTLLMPEKLYANRYDWQPPTDVIDMKPMTNYVAVVIEKAAMDDLVLDGSAFDPDSVSDITSTTKVSLWKQVKGFSHCLYHKNPHVTFFAMLHGLGKSYDMSYLCPAGFGRAIYCCEFCGDPHLTTFVGWKASLPLRCAYLVTRLRLTNHIFGDDFYEEIEFIVWAGNGRSRYRYYVSDVKVEVTFWTGNTQGPSNVYYTGENDLPTWQQDNGNDMQGRVQLGYDAFEHMATLYITDTNTGIQFRPVHRGGGGRLKDGRPFLKVWVGSAELIYDGSIEFPNTMCSTVDDDPSDNHLSGVNDNVLGLVLVLINMAPNIQNGQQSVKCSQIEDTVINCPNSEIDQFLDQCLALLYSLSVQKCVLPKAYDMATLLHDCAGFICNGDQCPNPYTTDCTQIPQLAPAFTC